MLHIHADRRTAENFLGLSETRNKRTCTSPQVPEICFECESNDKRGINVRKINDPLCFIKSLFSKLLTEVVADAGVGIGTLG